MTKKTYPYLRKVFEELLLSKGADFKTVLDFTNVLNTHSIQTLYDSLELKGIEFYTTFIEPWRNLTDEQLTQVVALWNAHLLTHRQWVMNITTSCDYRALQWTLVNVYETQLFDVFLDDYESELSCKGPIEQLDWITHSFVAPIYSLPYKQCRFCGRLDTDPRGRAFGKRNLNFCHLTGCPSDPSPSSHPTGCCYGDWKRIKNNIRLQCKRTEQEPQKVIQAFIQFVKERYEHNVQVNKIMVRVQQEKPKKWASVADQTAIFVYPNEHPASVVPRESIF